VNARSGRGQTGTLHFRGCEGTCGVSAAKRKKGQAELFLLIRW
jgi:hypothetical protein